MSDLKKYILQRKEEDKDFALNFDEGYQSLKNSILSTPTYNNLQKTLAEIEHTQEKLIKSELSGFTNNNRNEILAKSKKELRQNGEI